MAHLSDLVLTLRFLARPLSRLAHARFENWPPSTSSRSSTRPERPPSRSFSPARPTCRPRPQGNATISNDGATILKLLDIVHPAARTLVDIARAQDAEVGDGTTSVVLLAGEILKEIKGFVEDGVGTWVIQRGLREGGRLAVDKINEIAVAIDKSDPKCVPPPSLPSPGTGGARAVRLLPRSRSLTPAVAAAFRAAPAGSSASTCSCSRRRRCRPS